MAGGEGEGLLCVVEGGDGGDGCVRFVGVDGCGVCVEVDPDARVGDDFFADCVCEIALGERRPFGEAECEVGREWDGRVVERGEECGGEGEIVYAEDLLDGSVVRLDFVRGDGPWG